MEDDVAGVATGGGDGVRDRANHDWTIPNTPQVPFEAASLAVLMDVRQELRNLNLLLRCDIQVNTPKPRRRKAAKR